jgi:uncharacterized lipoprotein NlpE involved in copper resistance
MKKVGKLLGVITLTAVIGFSLVSCNNDTTGDDTTGDGGNGDGGAFTFSDPVVTFGITATDFSYILGESIYDEDHNWVKDTFSHLSNYITGTPSVKINGSKVNISFGDPKPEYMEDISENIPTGITISPIDAKGSQFFSTFFTSDGKYIMDCPYTYLIYVDKDVTITGSVTGTGYGGTYTDLFNCALKQGWNYILENVNGSNYTTTYTASKTVPNGFSCWIVEEYY